MLAEADAVVVSLDAADAGIHDAMRGLPGLHERVLRGIGMEGTILYSLSPSAVVHYLLKALFHRALPPDAGEGSCAAIAADAHPRWYITSVPFNLRCG